MKHLSAFTLKWLVGILAVVALGLPGASAQTPKRVLVVTATKEFRHDSIPTAERIIAELGEKSHAFSVDYVRGGKDGKEDADVVEKMSPEALKAYDAVIFANTTGNLPIPDKDAFIDWIKSGKGFVGMHSASDTFHGYRPYLDMLGGEFQTHGAQVCVECLNQDRRHPATRHLKTSWSLWDEIYIIKNFDRAKMHGLLTLDKHPNTGVPGDYPIAWTKQVGSGRVFYTSLGHRKEVWEDPVYQKHVLEGIRWALGLVEADATPQPLEVKLGQAETAAGFKPLFTGTDLKGWKPRNPDGHQSWSAQNGMLVNVVTPNEHGTDLVSEEKFKDFAIRYEYMVPKGANSGFYLRGRYEIQIFDDCLADRPEITGNGALYNFKAPATFVSRPPGEWQTVEATIRGDKITVILNGVKIHDEVKIEKATGGELDNNLNEPGPILLQGDHGSVAFRRIRIKALD
ncbi:MAG: ThuA domain-containing protein [Verrucomicrobiota bacterium]